MARGFERPPWWAVAVMVIGVAFLAVGLPIALNRAASGTASTPDTGLPLVQEQAAPTAGKTGPKVLVVGDSYTSGSAQGGQGASEWARTVASRLAQAGQPIRLDIAAAGGSGYVARGPSGLTFDDLVKKNAEADDALIVFFGSRNDGRVGTQAAAAHAYSDAKAAARKATILVIGPPWVNSDPPGNIVGDRDAVKAAATAAGATFVDPLAEDWFGGQYSALIGADGIHPTDAGHRHLADLILPHIRNALH